MPKSRFEELYPKHKCDQCALEHVMIAPIIMKARNPGEADIPLIPFEVIAVFDGLAEPGRGMPGLDKSKAHVVGLLWGHPGSGQVKYRSVLYLN